MPGTQVNQRRYLRYCSPNNQIYQLLFEEKQGDAVVVNALVYNKSHAGFACVIVGPPPAQGVRFYHMENEKIHSLLALRHHRELSDGLQLLGFERTDGVIRVDE